MRLLLVVFFIEAGLVLVFAPWCASWEDNYLLRSWLPLHALAMNDFARGAVSGVGVLNVAAAVAEMHAFFVERRAQDRVSSITHAPPAED
jgi:hypothetical protein